MKELLNVGITLAVLLGLFGVLAALPFIVLLIVLLVLGYFIYACVHDIRLQQEKEKATHGQQRTDDSAGSE